VSVFSFVSLLLSSHSRYNRGLGKTLQSISILAYLLEFKKVSGPHLIMVPKSTLSNWCNEFARWCPSFRVLRFHGSKDERQEIIDKHLKLAYKADSARDWDVCVTTYEIVNLEKAALVKIAWKYLIIDEAHRLKNEASQFSQTVRLLTTQNRLLLTGTPLQNNLHELWALLNFLLPDVFASSEQFDEWFNLEISDVEAKQRIISQLHKLLRPFMLRRLKVDVEKSLPPKTETILFTGMSTLQKNLYKQILLRDIDTINTAAVTGNSQQSRTAILNIVMQLRKCCNHPYLFPNQEDRSLNPMGEHLVTNCGKMVLLDKLLGKMKPRGHRVLIFSQMTRMLDILEDYLLSKGYLYCRIDGNTTYEDREDRIADFNREGSDKFVFILSTRAGGLGINLQTADTVILFDSDWNPQADLQAQDRAHRIGQKKPVQVFRLVTDESVEVKVVERAQQKLKLDAMVVQQGRLQDKEKKMSKQDLLDTLRFGADKVFRSKESTISDDDIDMILEEGRKRTEEMNEKLQVAEKGDMYDFRLDGGMATQMFEGKDYSDRNLREQELNNLMSGASSYLFLDPGKRERKTVASYSETTTRQPTNKEGEENKIKLPRHLRLNKMEDWQFYNKNRLNELQAEEIRLFDLLIERGEVPSSGALGKLVLLPAEQHEEKLRLLEEGFGDWTKVHFNNFIRASAKHGRNEYEKIAKDVGRPIDETKRYADTFWLRGQRELSPQEWEKAIKQVEKGEKRLEEISRLTEATGRLIAMFDDPWEELTFRNVGNMNRIFTAVEDRFLLCLTHLHGYGSWDQVRNSIRRCERFRFDFYLQSCSAETLGKRCELLMRSAERELLEIERKRQSSGNEFVSSSAKSMTPSEIMNQKLSEITKKVANETARLAALRSQLSKLKNSSSSLAEGKTPGSEGKKKSAKKAQDTAETAEIGAAEGKEGDGAEKGGDADKNAEEKKKASGQRGGSAHPVPESLYPTLTR
jgi:SWI/SNF-related matrix-associated actin-dependent regulator of chromatin subfamily A member 5